MTVGILVIIVFYVVLISVDIYFYLTIDTSETTKHILGIINVIAFAPWVIMGFFWVINNWNLAL